MYELEYERPPWWKPVAVGVAVALLLGIVLWQLSSRTGPDDADETEATGSTPASATTAIAPDSTLSTTSLPSATGDPAATVAEVDDTTDDTTDGDAADDAASTTVATSAPAAPTTVAGGDPPEATAATAPTTSAVESAPAGTPFGYPASPDGTPLPIVVIFDTETITIAGQVPSQAAKDRIAALAIANSKFPDAALIDNMVINPAVPITVGTRVIELNSARFPEGTAEIRPEHAAELDRVVNIMNALPGITVLVIGHADQRGDDVENFAISDERARAVVNYLLYLGISPTRLASRAAGESDLLAIGDDEAALALNRRTEFVFNGLLVE